MFAAWCVAKLGAKCCCYTQTVHANLTLLCNLVVCTERPLGADYCDINNEMLAQLAAWVGRGELGRCPNGSAFREVATSAPNKLTPSELKHLQTATSVYSKSSLGSQNGQRGGVTAEHLQQPVPVVDRQRRWQPDGESKRQEASPELMAALAKAGCFELVQRLRSSPSLVKCTGADR